MERQPSRRRRPALSCLECRRRKIKCDRSEPCTECVSAKAQCTYKVYRNKAGPWHSRSNPSSPSAQAQRISTYKPSTDYGNHSPGPLAPTLARQNDSPYTSGGTHNIQSPNRAENAGSDLRDLLQRVRRLEESSADNPVNGVSQTGQDLLSPQLGLQDSQIILNKTRILRWSHWMGAAQEFAPIFACYMKADGNRNAMRACSQDTETETLVVEMGDLLRKCKNIARSIKLGRPSRGLSYATSELVPPSREVSDTAVMLYFRSFESAHRIVHVPTFWTAYQRFWNHPENVPTDLRLKILLVIAIGSSLYENSAPDAGFRNMVHQWLYAAQTWLSGPLEKDRLCISGLQIHCLLILARQIFSIGGDLVWMSMGSLIHIAMQIGLHRDPKHLPAMSVLQAEVRRRLWATILEMVVQSSLDSALPPRISFDEFDTEAPSNNNDEEMNESTTALQPHPKATYTTTSMQLILLDSLPTRLRVLQLLNGLHSELPYLDVLALSAEVTKAYQECSNFMKEKEKSGVTPFHRNLLDYLLRRFMIPLHCQFASKARTNPIFSYSLKASLDAALAIISPEPDEDFSHLIAIGGGLFREGILCASTVISLELITQVEVQRLDGTLHRNSQHRELLKQALKDIISLSAERIRLGETNIKTHMFLSMVLAQAEAMETGASCEFKVVQSARDSLEFCHGLLQTLANTLALPSPNDTGLTLTYLGGGEDGYGLDFDLEYFFSGAGFLTSP